MNELKNYIKKVKAPEIDEDVLRNQSVDNLIGALKLQDARDKKTLRRTAIFLAVAGAFYLGIFVLTWFAPPDNSPGLHRVILGVIALVFLSIGIYSRRKSSVLSGIDYAQPVGSFLVAAEERYRFFRVKDLLFTISYLIILTVTCTMGVMNGFERYFPSVDPAIVLLICCIFFPLVWVGAFLFGWREWKRRKEPLLREIRKLETSLMKEETA